MVKRNFSLVILFLFTSILVAGCSGKSDNSSGNGVTGNVNSQDAASYFTASTNPVVASSYVEPAMVNRNDRYDFDDDDDDDDNDGNMLYFQKNDGTIDEVLFNVNGANHRGYVDDVIYAGEGYLLAEVEGLATIDANGRVGRSDDRDRYMLININDGSIKELPGNRACGDDIELFEIVNGTGYSICEDAAYKIDIATLNSSPIGISNDDAYDDAAAVIFSNGTVLVTSRVFNQPKNKTSLINVAENVQINFDEPENYEFTRIDPNATNTFGNVLVAGVSKNNINYTDWKGLLSNENGMGEYYYKQMKFLFGDISYSDDDELELKGIYTEEKAGNLPSDEKYKFGNFKDKENKIYTLSLDYPKNNDSSTDQVVTLAEIAIDENGKISRTIKGEATAPDGAGFFSGILWNRKGTTSRHLDIQRAYDNKSYYTVDMANKTVTGTVWNITADDFTSLNSYLNPNVASRGKVYYGSAGIAFVVANNTLKYIKYVENAVANPVTLPASCNPSNISITDQFISYKCGSSTYSNDLADITVTPTSISQSGKVIGNIIEVKNKKR